MTSKSSRKKPAYQQISIIDDTDDEYKNKSNPTTKPKTFCEWIWHKPLSKIPLLYFLIGIVGSIGNAVFFLMDKDTAYIICGIFGSFICFYGMKHFYTLIGLKAQIDKMSGLNIKFGKERKLLSKEIDRIDAANNNLRETHNRLTKVNEQNRENLDNFREIQYNMDQFGKTSLAEIQDLQLKSKAIESRWHDNLYEHQKQLLHTVFERMERQGSQRGMNREEFKEFEQQLPEEYRMRFDRMGTFQKLSENDQIIDYDDFRAALDVFAEMATDDVDIDFEIQKKAKSTHSKKGRSKQIKFTKMDSLDEDNDGDNDEYKVNEHNMMMMSIPSVDPMLQETESIDLEDVEFDEDGANETLMYDRKIVVTKRTPLRGRFKSDMNMSLFSDHSSSASDNDNDDDNKPNITKPETPLSSGIVFKKHHFKVTDESGNDAQIKLKSLGVRQFSDILDSHDNQ